MKEFKGTKGDWEIMMDDDEIKVIQSSSLENGSGWRSYVAICEEVQCIEDANLIEAAPGLLKALQQMVERIEYYASLKETEQPNIEDWAYTYNSGDMDEARAAIRKALGE